MAYVGTGGAERVSADRAVAVEALAREAVVANPRDQSAQQRLCELLVRQNRLPEAEMALRKAITWLPELPSLRIQLAFVLTRKGDHKAAREVLSQAARQMPPGSRMQQEVAKTAASFGPSPEARPQTTPYAEAKSAARFAPAPQTPLEPAPYGREQSLQLTADSISQDAEPGYPALELDDVTPAGIADLMRAGPAAQEPADEPDLAPIHGEAAWGVPPEQFLRLHAPWRLAGTLAAIATVAVLTAVLVAQRVDIVNRHMPALPWLMAVPTAQHPHPAAAPKRAAPKAAAPKAAASGPAVPSAKPQSVPPARPVVSAPPAPAILPLPEAAIPIVMLTFTDADAAARRQAEALGDQLRADGVLVTGLHPVPPGETPPGISYVYAEDRAAAETLLHRLGDRYGPLVARGPARAGIETPGSITINLP